MTKFEALRAAMAPFSRVRTEPPIESPRQTWIRLAKGHLSLLRRTRMFNRRCFPICRRLGYDQPYAAMTLELAARYRRLAAKFPVSQVEG